MNRTLTSALFHHFFNYLISLNVLAIPSSSSTPRFSIPSPPIPSLSFLLHLPTLKPPFRSLRPRDISQLSIRAKVNFMQPPQCGRLPIQPCINQGAVNGDVSLSWPMFRCNIFVALTSFSQFRIYICHPYFISICIDLIKRPRRRGRPTCVCLHQLPGLFAARSDQQLF